MRPSNLREAAAFEEVQAQVAELLKGRIVVGHAIENDLEVRQGLGVEMAAAAAWLPCGLCDWQAPFTVVCIV